MAGFSPAIFVLACDFCWHMLQAYAMNMERPNQRHVRLFRNGRNQAVRIPREFELPGERAIMRKEGDKLIIEPAPTPNDNLLEWLATLEPIEDEFPEIDDPPPDPVDL
jgi:antitoxin VapB